MKIISLHKQQKHPKKQTQRSTILVQNFVDIYTGEYPEFLIGPPAPVYYYFHALTKVI